jgi:hypothetical protein
VDQTQFSLFGSCVADCRVHSPFVKTSFDELSDRGLLLHIARHLEVLDRKLNTIMATQAELDTAVASITTAVGVIQTEVGQLTTANTQILAEIAALRVANPALDLTGLNSAVDTLSAATTAIKAAADAVEAIPPVPPV